MYAAHASCSQGKQFGCRATVGKDPESARDPELCHLTTYLGKFLNQEYKSIVSTLQEYVTELTPEMTAFHESWVRHCTQMEHLPTEETKRHFLEGDPFGTATV